MAQKYEKGIGSTNNQSTLSTQFSAMRLLVERYRLSESPANLLMLVSSVCAPALLKSFLLAFALIFMHTDDNSIV